MCDVQCSGCGKVNDDLYCDRCIEDKKEEAVEIYKQSIEKADGN